ncbi:hypothetical protein N657DRAFT_575285 [Parathielavia appendiculata]|uniref:Uncharacterized protein n=1 Tax=Parathielavia appendiculata TaxID=2587402 RepID=A0AAN6TXP0_9PEZI|nr:hypothetical protein N657DRAFT_575285 [Parathielavia appendiculata]
MAASARSRPRAVEIHIHDDHSHKETPSGTATSALGELPLNNIHNLKSRSSIESLAHRLDNFHIYSSDKENKSRLTVEPVSRVPSATLILDENNPLAVASQRLPSTKEQLSKHQEGQFEWLLSIPVKSAAKGRRPRGDSHDDAELHHGEKTLYFGCNLVRRRTQSGGVLENGKSTDVYTLLATRIKGEEDFAMAIDAEIAKLQSTTADRLCLSDAPMAEHYLGSDMLKSPGLVLDVKEVAEDSDGDGSRPLSQIEDSGEALEKLEEEIGALGQVAQLEQVLSPEATTRNTNGSGAKPTPMKGATSGRAGATPTRARTVERASSVHRPTSTGNDEKTAPGSATSSARKVPRPTSLLPPKPPAKSSKAPTVPTFELPGEAVARRLKEQREQRRSQQVSSEQAAALAAAYSPSKPHFKSTKPPTRPTFELPGEAISRKKREEREAKLRAQEEEERKRREFKARPIRASLVPNTIPRETRTSLVRQKSRTTEGSSDSATTTITPVSKKRHSLVGASGTPAATTSATFHSRGRNPDSTNNATATTSRRAHSTTPSQASIHSRSSGRSKQTGDEVAAASVPPHKPLRGKEVYARDNAVREERERERREREQAARVAREKAAERSREMSRLWAEKQRLKREMEMRTEKMAEQVPERERAC